MFILICTIALIVLAIYAFQMGKPSDPFFSRRERYRLRRDRAPQRPIDPTFHFDNPPDSEQEKPSGSA